MDDIRKPDVTTVAITREDRGLTILRVVINEYIPNPYNPKVRMLYKHYDINDEYIESIISKYVSDGHWIGGLTPISWRIVDNDFVNENVDSTFRDAWVDLGNNKPDVDMIKARDIHREKLREIRLPLLNDLDIEYTKADEAGDINKKKEITDRKRKLRDITKHPDIDNAVSPEQLKVAALKEF